MRMLLLALVFVGCASSAAKEPEELPEMSVEDVAAGLEAKQLTAVDCNGDATRKKYGVLPGAILVSDEESYVPSVLPADKAAVLAFYCGGPGCSASHVGAKRAKGMGHTNVYVMTAGTSGWAKAGKPTRPL